MKAPTRTVAQQTTLTLSHRNGYAYLHDGGVSAGIACDYWPIDFRDKARLLRQLADMYDQPTEAAADIRPATETPTGGGGLDER